MPAYTNVVGKFPEYSDEVMLSISTLNKMGIEHPKIGMDIPISILWRDWTKNEDKAASYMMRLSGYFTEYLNKSVQEVPAYLSKKFLIAENLEEYPSNIFLR